MLTILPALALAQVQYYGIDATLSDTGRSSVHMTITFQSITNNFNFTVFGKIENFNASSIGEPANCTVAVAGLSFVDCQLKLTQDKRTIEIYYETNDFVKTSNNRNFFDTDFSISQNIAKLSVTIKIPEGNALVEGDIPNRLSFPQSATTLSDGRRIIILWSMDNVPQTTILRFQVLYEKVAQSTFLSFWPYIVVGAVIIAGAVYFVFRYSKRTEKLVLSVLDEYEKKVVDIINNAGGEANQKRIVQETNLSKAKVSRVVKSLVDRGVVEIERIGRTNKVKLLKKKFKI